MTDLPNQPWTLSSQATLEHLKVSLQEGLSTEEIKRRQEEYGKNRLEEAKRRSGWKILLEQFMSPIIGILAVAAVVSFSFQEWIEGVAIVFAILINAVIGFFTEYQAVRSMQALQELSKTMTKVRRDGQVQEISAEEMVPGDIAVLDSGDVIAADLRVIEASNMQVNESALTGESVPVSKTTELIEDDLPLAERTNMLYKGTALTRGTGEGVVVATGMKTELGHISELAEKAGEDEQTPLEKRLNKLGRRLIWVTLAILVVIVVAGVLAGRNLYLMAETAIALAVAAIPEGLPIVATVALARGMWRMAKRHALINKLSAVETLGSTSVICTDKTGTLTENRMTVSKIWTQAGNIEVTGEGLDPQGEFKKDSKTINPSEQKPLQALLEVAVLCNNAALQPPDSNESRAVGDPMEVALLVAGIKAQIQRDPLLEKLPEEREEAFDPDSKMMATFHHVENGYRVAVKGAPESVLKASSRILNDADEISFSEEDRNTWRDRMTQLAEQGLRTLAFAQKQVSSPDTTPYQDLTFLGVVGLLDPPREDVKAAIDECQQAGIRVIMVTGDQAVTARNIALAVGLTDDQQADVVKGDELKNPEELSEEQRQRILNTSVLARVSPEQKLNLVNLHQKTNAVVAMTGDGVNDAPALKKANIGVAMGARGTQVAKEAADMVLQDDAFSTIVAAVEQGRAIFNNIRKFTIFLLSGNVGQMIAVTVTSLANTPLPILPLQILYLNIVNDVFPALALGVGEGSPTLMKEPPRDPKESIIARRHWIAIASYGVLIAVPVLGIFALALTYLGMEENKAITLSFLTIAFARLWHVFNMRDTNSNIFNNEVTRNPYVWGAIVLCTGLLVAAIYLPFLSNILQTVDPGLNGWMWVIGMSLIPLVVGQLFKLFKSR